MTRDVFKSVVIDAIEAVTVAAELRLSRELPRRYILSWIGGPVGQPGDDIAELLTERVFVSEEEVFPCVDLFLDDIDADDQLRIVYRRAGYKPGAFGKHWQYRTGGHDAGRVGPFKLSCGGIVEKLSTS